MYTLNDLKKGINNPKLVKEELSRQAVRQIMIPYNVYHRKTFERKHGEPEQVITRDWDYLIILDACRYDTFSKLNWIDGELQYIISAGSHSREFAEANFQGQKLYDTVYVTANGHGARLGQGTFHDLIFTKTEDSSGTHPSVGGLHPETVNNHALDAYREHPDKRMIIHYMQPHSPYFGDKAKLLRERVKNADVDIQQHELGPHLGKAAREGAITLSDFKEIYEENLEFVLQHVEILIKALEGRIIITADHGELLGDITGLWKYNDMKRQTPSGVPIDHPENIYVPELRKVPFLIIESDKRPDITFEKPTKTASVDHDDIEDRLAALGYK